MSHLWYSLDHMDRDRICIHCGQIAHRDVTDGEYKTLPTIVFAYERAPGSLVPPEDCDAHIVRKIMES
jgi:hypothetical protein